MTQSKVYQMTQIAMMTVIIVICSWITIPFLVPFTLQTFGIFFSLRLLGGKNGVISIVLYILLGSIGIPVFSGFTGGIGHLIGPTGGYILGFLGAGILYWILNSFIKSEKYSIAIMLICLIVCYLFGTVWFMNVYAKSRETMGIIHVMKLCVLPFILPDITKIILANLVSRKMKMILEIK